MHHHLVLLSHWRAVSDTLTQHSLRYAMVSSSVHLLLDELAGLHTHFTALRLRHIHGATETISEAKRVVSITRRVLHASVVLATELIAEHGLHWR